MPRVVMSILMATVDTMQYTMNMETMQNTMKSYQDPQPALSEPEELSR